MSAANGRSVRRALRSDICQARCYMPHLCSGRVEACLMTPKAYYPLFADLHGRRCVVIGGGPVAQRKVTTLLGYGADLVVVSPQATARIRTYARRGRLQYLARRFRPNDLRGAWLAYAATDDSRINAQVFRTAQRLRVFANIVDQTPLCSFIAPAIFRRDSLTIAISTGGGSPSLAKRLRRDLEKTIGTDYARMLKLLRSLRGVAKRELPNYNDRKRYFDQLVQGRVFRLVRNGRSQAARRAALTLLQKAAVEPHRLTPVAPSGCSWGGTPSPRFALRSGGCEALAKQRAPKPPSLRLPPRADARGFRRRRVN